MKFSSLTLGSRYSSLPVWMLCAVPSHPFGWLFFWPQIVFSHAHTVQVSAEYLRRVLCGSLEFSFCATISPTGLCPILAPSVPGFSALCLQLRKFMGCYLGSPSLSHGLGTLSRQKLGKPLAHLVFHLVFIAWCRLSSKALFHIRFLSDFSCL